MTDDEQIIADCVARESRLSDWERGFVDSLGEALASGRTLSERQREILERIWDKATEKG